jgi:hypothetical protein
MDIDMAAPAKAKDGSPEPAAQTRTLRTDGADTASERVAAAANSPESRRVVELTAEVERLNKLTSNLNGLVDAKNKEIAELGEKVDHLQRQIGLLAVQHVQAGAVPKGLTVLEFKDARAKGHSGFVVLTAFESRTKTVKFHPGQGLDARQHPRLSEYIEQGLLLSPLPAA